MPIAAVRHRIARLVFATLLGASVAGFAIGQITSPLFPGPPATPQPIPPTFPSPADVLAQQNLLNINAMRDAQFAAQERMADAQQQWQVEQDAARRAEIIASGLLIFPPFPTALAASIKARDGLVYPEILTDYAGESFFMPYGSLRLRGLLFAERLRRADDYRANRDKLVRELRDTLAPTRDKSGAVQPEALSRLAQAQEKKLAALEAEAESIRVDLTTSAAPTAGSFLRAGAATSQPFDAGAALTNAREKVKAGEQPGLKNYLSAILAAQFEPGLSLDERLMLQEIAADSLVTAQTAAGSARAELHFFLPGSARVRWPDNPNQDLANKLALFQEKRAALKREISDAVIGAAGNTAGATSAAKYPDLAKAQAPKFAELETLAEEIRVALAGLPYPDEPAPSAFPADLITHVGQMMNHKSILLREVQHAGKELGDALTPERVEVVYQNNTASLAARPAADPAAAPAKNRKKILALLQARNDEFKKRFAVLATEMNAVRGEIQRYHDSLSGPATPDVNTLSIQLARASTVQENWNRYRDYRDAVLTPGLSAAQRRLLFSAALVDLEKYRLSQAN